MLSAVSKIYVHRLTDLPSAVAVAIGDPVGNSQRFNLNPTALTRRLYTIRVEGPHELGMHVVLIQALGGDILRSNPVEIPQGAENAIVTAELVGPIFGEFVVSMVKVADVPRSETPKADDTAPEADQGSADPPQ